jgi:hypothetical protein
MAIVNTVGINVIKKALLTLKVRIIILLDYLIVFFPAWVAVQTLVAVVLGTFGALIVLVH